MGIIGMGSIGCKMALRAKTLEHFIPQQDMEVKIYFDPIMAQMLF